MTGAGTRATIAYARRVSASVEDPSRLRPRVWPVVLWLIALAAVFSWGKWLVETGQQVLVLDGSQPFLGGLIVPDPLRLVLPGAMAGAGVVILPIISRRLRWRWLLVATVVWASVWSWALTTTRGWSDFVRPLYRDDDYLNVLPITDLHGFVASFTDTLLAYPLHVQGHPPGQVVILALADSVGLAIPWLVAVAYVVIGCSGIAAAAVTVRVLAGAQGEALARRMLPAAILASAAVWIATSPDAFFSGVLAWGVALLAIASVGSGWRRWVAAAGAGLLLGLCPFLSYGLIPMGLITVAVLVHTRAWKVFGFVAALVVIQALVWAAVGFRLDEGIAATRVAWQLDGASIRPYWYFLIANSVVLATLVGPAVLGSLPRTARLPSPVPLFVLLAAVAAAVGALSGYMRGEVERIWLPLTPWLMLAAAVVSYRRSWLVAQALVTVAAAAFISSPW